MTGPSVVVGSADPSKILLVGRVRALLYQLCMEVVEEAHKEHHKDDVGLDIGLLVGLLVLVGVVPLSYYHDRASAVGLLLCRQHHYWCHPPHRQTTAWIDLAPVGKVPSPNLPELLLLKYLMPFFMATLTTYLPLATVNPSFSWTVHYQNIFLSMLSTPVRSWYKISVMVTRRREA